MHRVQQRHIWLGCYERKVQKTKTLFIMLCTACPLTGLINIRFGLSCRQRVSWGALWFTKLWSVLPKRSTQKGKWHTGSWMSGNFEENKCMFLRFSGSEFMFQVQTILFLLIAWRIPAEPALEEVSSCKREFFLPTVTKGCSQGVIWLLAVFSLILRSVQLHLRS